MYELKAAITLRDGFSKKLRAITAQAEQSQRRIAKLSVATTAVGSALSTTGAVGVAAIGGLSASFTAAGIGAVAFGSVAASALTQVFDAASEVEKIQERIDSASSVKERVKAQAELAAVYADMSKAQRGALTDLQEFKSFWSGFVKKFEEPIFKSFSQALQSTQKIFEKMAPTISNVSDTVLELMTNFNKSLDGSGAAKFFGWLESNASEALRNFANIAGNTLSGFYYLIGAFSPLGAEMEEGLVSLTEKFKNWAASLSSSNGFQTFIDYVRTNGPTLLSILGNVGKIIGNVAVALAPLGPAVLQAVDGFAKLVEKVTSSKEAMYAIGFAIGTVGSVMLGMKIVGTVVLWFGKLKKALDVAKAAMVAFNAVMYANPIGIVIGVITLLVAAFILAYKKSSTFRNAIDSLWANMKKFGGWVKDKFIAAFDGIKELFGNLKESFGEFKSMLSGFTIPAALKKAGELFGKVTGGGSSSGGKSGKKAYHGESYVPYNNKPYLLHKGERVLTAKENREYSRGGGGNTIHLSVNYHGGQKLDRAEMDRFASYLAKQLYEAGSAGA
jgi:hypothetical protein